MISLQPNEAVLYEAHRHWLAITVEGVIFGLIAAAPVALLIGLSLAFPTIAVDLITSRWLFVIIFFASGWALLLWVLFFIVWTNYFLDLLIITNQRLIDAEQFRLFSRDQVSVPLDQIQDIKIETFGLLPTIFKFGNLYVQTAGTGQEVVIRNLNHPDRVKQAINDAYNLYAANIASAAAAPPVFTNAPVSSMVKPYETKPPFTQYQ